ncbi:MAG: vWA domain-containing protein, partial [Planctomycetota bacterium]
MTTIVEWLLGLQNIRWQRDSPLLLQWEREVEPWVLFSLAILAAAVVGAVYVRERLSLARMIAPAAIRFLLIALVAALLCGPAVVLQRNRTEPSCVVLLVDSSQSMSRKELYRDEEFGKRAAAGAGVAQPSELNQFTRLDLARRALQQNNGAGFRAMTAKQAVQLSTFAGGMETLALAQEPARVDELLKTLGEVIPDGGASDLAAALSHTLENPLGRRLSAIVVVSDGQVTAPGNMKDAVELAQGRQVPIFAVRTGSSFVQADVELGPSKLEEAVYLHDVFSVQACVSIRGSEEPRDITVQLKDVATDANLASAQVVVDPKHGCAPVELRVKPTRIGRQRFRVEAVALPGEENLENNAEVVEIQVIDARLRILYVDAYPRYEYRYLKNALLREQTAELS